MGLPACQSVVTFVPNRYCLMRSGFVSASHTLDAGALMAMVALATNVPFMTSLLSHMDLFDSGHGRPVATIWIHPGVGIRVATGVASRTSHTGSATCWVPAARGPRVLRCAPSQIGKCGRRLLQSRRVHAAHENGRPRVHPRQLRASPPLFCSGFGARSPPSPP